MKHPNPKYWDTQYQIDYPDIPPIGIEDTIRNAITSPRPLQMVHTKSYTRVHDLEQPPLMYILLKELSDEGLLQREYPDIPDITDFKKFIDWYETRSLPIDQLVRMVKSSSSDRIGVLYDIILNCQTDRKYLHDLLYRNNFVSCDVQQHAETCNLKYSHYENEIASVHLYEPDGTEVTISNISLILNVMYELAKSQNLHKKINMTIFAGKQKKKFPKEGSAFTRVHINSGSCYPGLLVNVWRREEMAKVMIHELIHYFGFDYFCDNVCKQSHPINRYIQIIGEDCCNESFVEALAILILANQIHLRDGIPLKDLMQNEMKFLLFQISRIIRRQGGKSWNDVWKGRDVSIRQYTSVCSYFFVKAIILANLPLFVGFLNRGFAPCEKFKDILPTLLEKGMPEQYVQIINRLIESASTRTESTSARTESASARMTTLDL